ncbi:MAG: transposase [Proteobacteria bacterium]|nr:transposase [Pseudomonadota bacterium]
MAGIYRQHHPEHSVFYRVFFHCFEEFLREYEKRFEREYGYLRPVIQEVVDKYLDCGNPKCGFARIRCPDCGTERLLTFSCKVRGLCPSCHAKRREEWGEWMREELILDVPHRQVVFTIPKMLRIFFKYKRSLLSSLCLYGKEAILKYLRAVTGKEITPGIIAVIQSFGSKINLHPHLHFLLTEGGVAKDGRFLRISKFNDTLLCRFFTREVFSMLLRQGLINLELVQKILRWRHTGFNVHTDVRPTSKDETERVGKYMIRPILSLKRISFDETEGMVSYQYGKGKVEEDQMDYLEFIARVTSHIPDKGQVMIRYYGIYSNAHRGKRRKAKEAENPFLIIEQEEPFVPSRDWAEMIRKVYETDPLLCPRCGGQMSIISFIEDHKVIDKIIRHLKLTFHAERPPPPQVVQQELLMVAEEREEYF